MILIDLATIAIGLVFMAIGAFVYPDERLGGLILLGFGGGFFGSPIGRRFGELVSRRVWHR